jgi:hypothetical protein
MHACPHLRYVERWEHVRNFLFVQLITAVDQHGIGHLPHERWRQTIVDRPPVQEGVFCDSWHVFPSRWMLDGTLSNDKQRLWYEAVTMPCRRAKIHVRKRLKTISWDIFFAVTLKEKATGHGHEHGKKEQYCASPYLRACFHCMRVQQFAPCICKRVFTVSMGNMMETAMHLAAKAFKSTWRARIMQQRRDDGRGYEPKAPAIRWCLVL